MFEGRFWELALLIVLALVVFGPERLPGLARGLGRGVGRARALWRSLSEQLEREIAAEELRTALTTAQRAVRDPLTAAQASVKARKHEHPID